MPPRCCCAPQPAGRRHGQAGTNLQYLDSYFFGKQPLWSGHDLSFKIGRLLVNWGESTTLQINSINSANPINANKFYRVGEWFWGGGVYNTLSDRDFAQAFLKYQF